MLFRQMINIATKFNSGELSDKEIIDTHGWDVLNQVKLLAESLNLDYINVFPNSITTDHLENMITSLDSLYPKKHAPSDGKGCYLGNGVTDTVVKIRSDELSKCLKELLEYRKLC